MHTNNNDARLDIKCNQPQMVGPVCQEIGLAHVYVSLRLYDILVFVAYVHYLTEKSKKTSANDLAKYQENLNPKPRFKRALRTRQIFPVDTRYIEPVMLDSNYQRNCKAYLNSCCKSPVFGQFSKCLAKAEEEK